MTFHIPCEQRTHCYCIAYLHEVKKRRRTWTIRGNIITDKQMLSCSHCRINCFGANSEKSKQWVVKPSITDSSKTSIRDPLRHLFSLQTKAKSLSNTKRWKPNLLATPTEQPFRVSRITNMTIVTDQTQHITSIRAIQTNFAGVLKPHVRSKP